MTDIESLRLELEAERHNHRRDNEYLIEERDRLLAKFALAAEHAAGREETIERLVLDNARLREALLLLLYGTDCELDSECRSVFRYTTTKLAQARAALAPQ